MPSVNLAIVVGHLGRDPELRETPGGRQFCKFSLATTEKWTDKDGQKSESTCWHNIVVWGRQAEVCMKYLRKGRLVYIQGRIDNRSYEDDGVRKYISEIKADRVQFMGSRPIESDQSRPEPTTDEPVGGYRWKDQEVDVNDDIPF